MTATLPSPTNLQPNLAWATLPFFDRTGWKRMAFGEFAESIGERAEPKDAQEEIYVGLEHLDPQCLHIRRWGKGSDVIGGKLRFRKGDIIFGKRRAYQRKLAVAEFGGICSAHAMVIRARPDKVLPEFLPFLMMSDRFMNRAVEISVGSLSPTINWTTLKLETFDLPPLDQQRRIAEILWAVDEVIGSEERTLASIEEALGAVKNAESVSGVPNKTIGDCCGKLGSGKTPRGGEKVYSTEGVLFLRSQNVHPDGLVLEDAVFISPEIDEEMRSTRVQTSDVLLNITGASIGRCTIYNVERPANVNQHVCILRAKREAVLPAFLAGFLQSEIGQKMIATYSTKGNREGLNFAQLSAIPIHIPSIERQQKVCEQIRSLEDCRAVERTHLASCLGLRSEILNSLFA